MNISINQLFKLILFFVFIFSSFLVYQIIQLDKRYSAIIKIDKVKNEMSIKAQEIRQSSNDLTKYARLYVVTGEENYKQNFFKILDIRDGKAKKPMRYNYIYWDILEPQRSELHPLDKKTSLKDEILELPFSKYELKKLKQAYLNSNELINLETEAFNALQGLYKDHNGSYTIEKEPNQQYAIELLHSHQYLVTKEKVMLPIDYFLMFLDERHKQMIEEINQEIYTIFQKIYGLLTLLLIGTVFIIFIVYKKVIKPVNALTDTIKNSKQGDRSYPIIEHYNDEIGLLIKNFFRMRQNHAHEYQNVKNLASKDVLTNCMNKRTFLEQAESILRISKRQDTNLTLLMIDVDNFKNINDVYGHLAGDEILKSLVQTIQKHLRESDIFARFGGEEFVILLSNMNTKNEVFKKAQELRIAINYTPYRSQNQKINYTVSIGLTQEKREDQSIKDLIQRADEALYTAKRNGRNQVEMG